MQAPPAARLPLPGGSPGAVVEVTGLLTATMSGPRAYFLRERGARALPWGLGLGGECAGRHTFPVGAFLVRHPTGGALLVDAGLASEAASRPARAAGRVGTAIFGRPRMRGGLAARLAELGATPDVVVMTHMHWDHASGLADLPAGRALVTEAEWRAARRRLGPLRGYLRRHLRVPVAFELIDFSSAPPWGPFDRSLDLFGDGSVMLVATPGHSRGHISVALRLRDRTLLIAGDALLTMRNLRERTRPWSVEDPGAYRRSLAAIAALVRERQTTVVPGHDLDAWEASGVEDTL